MPDNPITVLMSVYNEEKFLREAIESTLKQTFQDFELLIIDDASTDNSRDIILSYDDPRIRLINNKRNIGLTSSLNKGLKLARGDYVARIDADDVSFPERLEKQLGYITENENVGLVSCWYEVIDGNGERISTVTPAFTYEDIYYNLTFYNCLAHSTAFYDKKLVLNLGGYDETYKRAQDYALWYKLSRVSRVEMLNEVLVKWRNLSTNITSMFKNEQDSCAYEIFADNVESLLSREIDKRCLQGLYDYNYLYKMDSETVKKTIDTLSEINQTLIGDIPPALNVNLRKVEKNAFDKAWVYMAHLLKQKRFFDFFMVMAQYPRKMDFLTFMPSKLKDRLRNII